MRNRNARVIPFSGNGRRRIVRGNDLPPDLNPFALNGLGQPPGPDDLRDLPPDLMPRRVREYESVQGARGHAAPRGGGLGLANHWLELINRNTGIIASTSVLQRGLIGRSVTINTTPTLIVRAEFLRGFMFLNPASVIGTTGFGTILASSTQTTDGNTQSASLGVANYRDMHLFLDVTAVSGTTPTLDIIAQAYDPESGNWADTSAIWSGINGTGTMYANPGGLGLASDFAVRWVLGGSSPSFTFSIGYVLKDGLPGSAAGLSNAIYMGGPGVSSVSGFPLLEGQSRSFYLSENTELWGVAAVALELRVFEL